MWHFYLHKDFKVSLLGRTGDIYIIESIWQFKEPVTAKAVESDLNRHLISNMGQQTQQHIQYDSCL